MPRGGKRPGAGAPKGNLNALKHGHRSKQFAILGKAIAASPAARNALLRYACRADAEQREADELAGSVIEQIISRGLVRGRDRLILLPELLDEERTIRQTSPKPSVPKPRPFAIHKNTPTNNQSHSAGGDSQSDNIEETRMIDRPEPRRRDRKLRVSTRSSRELTANG